MGEDGRREEGTSLLSEIVGIKRCVGDLKPAVGQPHSVGVGVNKKACFSWHLSRVHYFVSWGNLGDVFQTKKF